MSETLSVAYLSSMHPTPWRVEYSRRFDEWHPKSRPCIVDANGCLVLDMPQHVGHPGAYDVKSDLTAMAIVGGGPTDWNETRQKWIDRYTEGKEQQQCPTT